MSEQDKAKGTDGLVQPVASVARPLLQREAHFDKPPEIFAADNRGFFSFPLTEDGVGYQELTGLDEIRLTLSLWHPSEKQVIDYDKAYVEVRVSLDPDDEHWTRIAEVEPVVPPYNTGQRFDGWIVLPVLSLRMALQVYGGGFAARSRIQLRSSAFFVG